MTDTRPQLVSETSISRAAAMMAAVTMIFLGVVFQWGQLGYDHFNLDGFWVVHMIATNLWNLLALHINVPGVIEIVKLWPLLLVAAGFAILRALRFGTRERACCTARDGENPGA